MRNITLGFNVYPDIKSKALKPLVGGFNDIPSTGPLHTNAAPTSKSEKPYRYGAHKAQADLIMARWNWNHPHDPITR